MKTQFMKMRIEAGYKTQKEFVYQLDKLGARISLRRYRLIEAGSGRFTPVELEKIAEALKTDVSELIKK